MDGGGTDDEFWAMRREVKDECGTVGFGHFEGYDHPTSSGRVTLLQISNPHLLTSHDSQQN